MFVYYVAAIFVGLVFAYRSFRPAFRSAYKKAFAHYMQFATPALNKLLITYKLDVFACLHDAKAEHGLEILEIGPGAGANFEFLPTGSAVICVEPNVHMHRILYENYEKFRNVINVKVVNMNAEDMTGVPDASMDVVISTFVLCSVSDVRKCIAEIRRVLKPSGRFCYVEHTVDPDKTTWTFKNARIPFAVSRSITATPSVTFSHSSTVAASVTSAIRRSWGRAVNVTKTKIMVLPGREILDEDEEWSCDGQLIEELNTFKYLGQSFI